MTDWLGIVDAIKGDKKNILVKADDSLILTRYGKDKIEDGIDTNDCILTILQDAERGSITPKDVSEDNNLPLQKVKDACSKLVKKGFLRQTNIGNNMNYSNSNNFNPMRQ